MMPPSDEFRLVTSYEPAPIQMSHRPTHRHRSGHKEKQDDDDERDRQAWTAFGDSMSLLFCVVMMVLFFVLLWNVAAYADDVDYDYGWRHRHDRVNIRSTVNLQFNGPVQFTRMPASMHVQIDVENKVDVSSRLAIPWYDTPSVCVDFSGSYTALGTTFTSLTICRNGTIIARGEEELRVVVTPVWLVVIKEIACGSCSTPVFTAPCCTIFSSPDSNHTASMQLVLEPSGPSFRFYKVVSVNPHGDVTTCSIDVFTRSGSSHWYGELYSYAEVRFSNESLSQSSSVEAGV
jgi:hypothetical protein